MRSGVRTNWYYWFGRRIQACPLSITVVWCRSLGLLKQIERNSWLIIYCDSEKKIVIRPVGIAPQIKYAPPIIAIYWPCRSQPFIRLIDENIGNLWAVCVGECYLSALSEGEWFSLLARQIHPDHLFSWCLLRGPIPTTETKCLSTLTFRVRFDLQKKM